MFQSKFIRTTTLTTWLVSLMLFGGSHSAQAGCGCSKPPPAPASARPDATYGGMPVTLFNSALHLGATYNVTFTSMSGADVTVSAQPVNKRDLADGVSKNQLVVTVPNSLPIGPASITVEEAGVPGAVLSIPDTSFTVVPQPIVAPTQVGTFSYNNYKAAVGRNGVVYMSLNVANIPDPRTFRAQAKGYPLRFSTDDAVFYNTQGFIMQLLNAPIPGLASITSSSTTDSDLLNYSRHEFNTHFLQHAENLPHATDPTDGNWHLDGSHHVDHDHLILAISGTVNGAVPAPGATPAFKLTLRLATLFDNGLVGLSSVTMNNAAFTDSFRSTDWNFGPSTGKRGDVLSNGVLQMSAGTQIDGDATAASILNSGSITGHQTLSTTPTSFLAVAIPNGLENLGAINLNNGTTRVIETGSYVVTGMTIGHGSGLVIDNSAGPVTLYVTGPINVSGSGSVTTTNPDPERFAVYVANSSPVTLADSGQFYGLLYAPASPVTLSGWSYIYGSLVGLNMTVTDTANLYYDIALRGE
ncbi:MAG: hypothetical protein AB7P69_14810 [Candidatus Binatia bacterium]